MDSTLNTNTKSLYVSWYYSTAANRDMKGKASTDKISFIFIRTSIIHFQLCSDCRGELVKIIADYGLLFYLLHCLLTGLSCNKGDSIAIKYQLLIVALIPRIRDLFINTLHHLSVSFLFLCTTTCQLIQPLVLVWYDTLSYTYHEFGYNKHISLYHRHWQQC